MKALIFSVVLALICSHANAEWKLLEESSNSIFNVHIENDSVKKTGLTTTKAWFLLDFKKPEKNRKGSYLSSKELIEFDCKDDKSRLLSSIKYSQKMGSGNIVDSLNEPNADWTFAAPDTISAYLLKRVCTASISGGNSNGTPTHVDINKLKITYQPSAGSYYPSFSKRSGEKGEVEVRIVVGETGVIESANVLRSSGFPRLDQAAIEVSKGYRFEPYLVNFAPARVSTNLLIKFNLY